MAQQLKRAASDYEYGYPSYESGYIEGDWDVIPDFTKRAKRAERVRTEIITQLHPEAQARRRTAVVNCVIIAVAFACMAIVISRNAGLCDLHNHISDAEGRITELQAQIENLQVKIVEGSNLNAVQQRAKELGMDFAEPSQVQYISVTGTATSAK